MLARQFIRRSIPAVRGFRTSVPLGVKVGDAIPAVELQEGAPSNTVNLAQNIASGKHIIIGVPGAYSPACSASHVPGYVEHAGQFKNKGIDSINVVAVNDSFVTGAWAKEVGAKEGSNVRVLADSSGNFTNELDLLFDASPFFGNSRSKRYALVVDNGKVTQAFVEPDNVSVDVSAADKVLSQV